MKVPAEKDYDFHFTGTPVGDHWCYVALMNNGALSAVSKVDYIVTKGEL